MVILGIDPGTATTGWGVIRISNVEFRMSNKKIRHSAWRQSLSASQRRIQNSIELVGYGCIVTSKEQRMGERLVQLRKSLKRLLQSQKPDVVCIEEHFFGKNKKTAITVSQARGVILETAASTKIPIAEYAGFKIKQELTGERYAVKKTVEKAVKRLLGRRKLTKPAAGFKDDAVDGIAIAIYHSLVSSK